LRERAISQISYTQVALVCFFVAATVMCAIAGVTLLAPSTALSGIWVIKPQEYADLLELVPWSGIGFLVLSLVMAGAAWGCWQRKLWGWRLAIAIFAANASGDIWQALRGRAAEGILGIAVAGAIILWLSRAKVKAQFN
jgi:hypothetical protein